MWVSCVQLMALEKWAYTAETSDERDQTDDGEAEMDEKAGCS